MKDNTSKNSKQNTTAPQRAPTPENSTKMLLFCLGDYDTWLL